MSNSDSTIPTQLQPTQHTASTITLAELLAQLHLRRPLYTHESGALCYQLIGQLENNLLLCSPPEGTTSLKFPTLANIWITETGLAFVLSVTNKYHPWVDWLIVLAQTLRHHTLITSTHESVTFCSLINSLSQSYAHGDQVLKLVKTWQTTCLFLCSLHYPSSDRDQDTSHLLERLHSRSVQARASGLWMNEMRGKHLSTYNRQSHRVQININDDDKGDQFNSIPKIKSTTTGRYAGLADHEAFNNWFERWRCVNAEFKARNIIRNGPNPSGRDPEMIYPAHVSLAGIVNRPMENSFKTSQSEVLSTEIPKSTLPFQGVCMRTLKTMYHSLIGKPLSLLQKGLKDVRYQLEPRLAQSGVVTQTLHGLDRILRDSDVLVSNGEYSEMELTGLTDRIKCINLKSNHY